MNKEIVTSNELNVRSGAGINFTIITKLTKSTVVEVMEISSNGWKKIKTSQGIIGWVNGRFLTKQSINKVQAVIDLANKQIGKPYLWGGKGPNSFDCSGLIYYIYKNAADITLPRTSLVQYSVGKVVSKSNIQPGDLIFFSTNATGKVTHVGMYIGNSQMIHAPRAGRNVEIININTNFWNKAYVGAKRIL